MNGAGKPEALIQAELCMERAWPSAGVDRTLRKHLELLRPAPGKADGIVPMLVIEMLKGDGDGRQMAYIAVLDQEEFWSSKQTRRNFIRMVGVDFADRKPVVIYSFTEAWTKTREKGQRAPGPLHLEEVKTEVVVAAAMTIDGRTGGILSEIERDGEGLISGYREMLSIPCGRKGDNGEPHLEIGMLRPFFEGVCRTIVECGKSSA
jgi:hypothetical protein